MKLLIYRTKKRVIELSKFGQWFNTKYIYIYLMFFLIYFEIIH